MLALEILLAFHQFLGHAVHQLQYWSGKHVNKIEKLNLNQLLLFPIKLKLNPLEDLVQNFKSLDLVQHFKSLVSQKSIGGLSAAL